MSGVKAAAVTGAIATGASAKTLLQLIAASNHRAHLTELRISFAGTSNTAAPIKVDIVKQTSAGTMTGLTPVKRGDFGETLQTTAQHTATAEPTTTDVIASFYVHPQGGDCWQAPIFDPIPIPGGGRIGVRVTAGADVNAIVTAHYEE